MLDVQVEEYRTLTGGGDPRKSNLFSRTNGFSFSDPAIGSLHTSVATTDRLGIRIGRVRSTGHEIDLTELRHSTLLLPTKGRLEACSRQAEFKCHNGEALLFAPNKRTTRTTGESGEHFEATVLLFPSETVAVNVERQALERTESLLESGVTITQADALSRPLLKFCAFLSSAVLGDSAAMRSSKHIRSMEALLIELYGELIVRLAEKNGDGGASSAGLRHVVRAEEFMRAKLDEPLTVSAISAAIGVSPRSLQLAFRQVRSATPREILSMMRLQSVHEKLKTDKSRAGVTDIVLDCGVANVGRFARSYREVYGENPSTTRRKARSSPIQVFSAYR